MILLASSLSMESTQVIVTGLYAITALTILTPLCLWWERHHP